MIGVWRVEQIRRVVVSGTVKNVSDGKVETFENKYGLIREHDDSPPILNINLDSEYKETDSTLVDNGLVSPREIPEGMTTEIVSVEISYGKGICFVVQVIAKIGASEERIKQEAIRIFKLNMPTAEEISSVEEMEQKELACISLKHEFK